MSFIPFKRETSERVLICVCAHACVRVRERERDFNVVYVHAS